MDLWKAVLLCFHISQLLGAQDEDIPKGEEQEESRLLMKLLRHYDRNVRPVRNSSHPVVIKLGITLTQIFDMDEKNQVLTTNIWLDQEWQDELLLWDPEDFNGLKTIRIPCDKIWLPDIVLYNSADDYTRGYMQSKAMVKYDGNVFWPPPTKFRSTCPVDVTYFPFDDQTCMLKLGSWTYDGFQVDVTNRTHDVDLSNYVPNGEWELIEARIVRNVVYYSCCPEPFPDVTITIVIRRKTLYYMYNVVVPCMMMSILTLLVFCLPPDSGEKIALGITVLLAFSVFMLAIAEKMPETSESIPLIVLPSTVPFNGIYSNQVEDVSSINVFVRPSAGPLQTMDIEEEANIYALLGNRSTIKGYYNNGIYLTAVMGITAISVIMTVVVLNFHHRGPLKTEVPSWARRLVLGHLASCVRIQTKPLSPSRIRRRRSEYDNTTTRDPTPLRLTVEGMVDDAAEYSSTESVNNLGDFTVHHHHHHGKRGKCSRGPGGGGGDGGGSNRLQDEILKTLRYLIAKQEQEDHNLLIVNEWRQIAAVVDRFLFWIFCVGTLVSSISFLVIMPMERRGGRF